MKKELVRSRYGTVISETFVCQELIVGRVVNLIKIYRKDGSFLIFARILSRGKLHRVLVPLYSPFSSDIIELQNKIVQAFIETVTGSGMPRAKLLDIEPYDIHTYYEFEKRCRL